MSQDVQGERRVQVTIGEFARWQAKIDRLNQRASRKGFPGRVGLTGERVVVVNDGRFDPLPRGVELVVVNATIVGDAPCYGDWRLVASLEALPAANGGPMNWLVHYAPGVPESTVSRAALRAGWCAHCSSRRPRRRLFAVQHVETGKVRQVGSTCIKDFLGWPTSPVFVSTKDVVDELESEAGWGDAFTPGTVVVAALAATEAVGWTSRSSARDYGTIATADLVGDYLLGTGRTGQAARDLLEPHLDAAAALAPEVIATVTADLAAVEDGYGANLYAALAAETVEERRLGLVCSTVALTDASSPTGPPPPPARKRRPGNGSAWSVTRSTSPASCVPRPSSTATPTTRPRCCSSWTPAPLSPSSTRRPAGRTPTTSHPVPRSPSPGR